MVTFTKAKRKKSKLRIALAGPAGSGKTYSSLLISFGLGGRVAMLDTENRSGELYSHLGDYDVAVIDPPFIPEKYIESIHEAERLGYDTIIIDSLSHAWAGQGGLLDIHGHITDKSGNSWTAWRQVTPRHNDLVEAILQSKCHIIATMRSKMDYVQTEENGKKVVKKVGMNPVQRDGMEYEFTVFMDIDINHIAQATKDRTSQFDGQVFKITPDTGRKLLAWLEAGEQAEPHILSNQPAKPKIFPVSEPVKPVIPSNNIKNNAPDDFKPATPAQIKKIFASSKAAGLSESDVKRIYREIAHVTSSKDLSISDASRVIDAILKRTSEPDTLFIPDNPQTNIKDTMNIDPTLLLASDGQMDTILDLSRTLSISNDDLANIYKDTTGNHLSNHITCEEAKILIHLLNLKAASLIKPTDPPDSPSPVISKNNNHNQNGTKRRLF